MEKIRGVNLGNWLVLERWMDINLFEGFDAEDEVWLTRVAEAEKLNALYRQHRDTYVTEDDFANIKAHGANLVRLPVPFFVFGDRPPFVGCIEYVDKAFDWAEKYDLPIMLDLHTVPGSQNGYDNGGLTGVCKWCKDKGEVEFALTVLERLAKRYGHRKGLYGIQAVNEPISWIVYATAPSTGKARDKAEAKGSGHVPMKFLRGFYVDVYKRLRAILPENKVIVFHDGFRLSRWKDFFSKNGMKNVLLDTHIYIFAMENFVPVPALWVYKLFVWWNRMSIRRAGKHIPVIVGEWCISQKYAVRFKGSTEERARRFRAVADLQLDAWSESGGYIYWNYQLWRDTDAVMDDAWKEPWDLRRCWRNGWMPETLE